MLALEVALAGADPVPTMVFDEVDAGVGGRAAVEIGRRLARLAARHQVIVVTHLPQVAAYADRHLVVDKSARDGRADHAAACAPWPTATGSSSWPGCWPGCDDTDTGRAHAEELLGRGPRAPGGRPGRRRQTRAAPRRSAGRRARPAHARAGTVTGRGADGRTVRRAFLGIPAVPAVTVRA